MTDQYARLRAACEALIADCYTDPRVNVEWLARRLNVSRRQLHRAFEGGTGVAERLARRRLAAAIGALAGDHDVTIQTAVARSGYASPETFRRHCRRYLDAGAPVRRIAAV